MSTDPLVENPPEMNSIASASLRDDSILNKPSIFRQKKTMHYWEISLKFLLVLITMSFVELSTKLYVNSFLFVTYFF